MKICAFLAPEIIFHASAETVWENEKKLYYDMQSHTCSFKMFSLIYTWYIRSALYPLYVGSADGEFIIFLRIHIIRDEEKIFFV